MAATTLFALTLAFWVLNANSCLFKQAPGTARDTLAPKYAENPYRKKFYYPNGQSPACQCGQHQSDEYPAWNLLYIYAKVPPDDKIHICMGTVVASNMVLASHSCFRKTNSKMYPYEAWKVANAAGLNTASIDKIKSNSIPVLLKNSSHLNLIDVKIKEVIYHPRYVLNTFSKNLIPDDDVVILITEGNLFSLGFNSMCLPESGAGVNDIVYRTGDYVGIGGVPGDLSPEIRFVDGAVIMKAEDCKEEGNFDVTFKSDDNLCIRFRDNGPRLPGGPLTVMSRGEFPVLTLVGLASVVSLDKENVAIEYAFFTNILPHIKYIEHYAEKHGSIWCEGPHFYPPEPVAKEERDIPPYPWDYPVKIPPRDESLNCLCGLRSESNVYERRKRSLEPEPRIAGGEEAMIMEFPWMIHLQLWNPLTSGISICGGSLINNKMILTAAHCVFYFNRRTRQHVKYKLDEVYVYARVHNFKEDLADPPDPNKPPPNYATGLGIAGIIEHPQYIPERSKFYGKLDFDIALIILDEAIDESYLPLSPSTDVKDVVKWIRTVCLPKKEEEIRLTGKTAYLSGWGLTAHGGAASHVLKKSSYPIRPLQECANMTHSLITRNMICATSYDVTDSALPGDSGSPLTIEHGNHGQRFQVGLTSFGDEFDEIEHVGKHLVLFTNVQRFLRFIDYYAADSNAKWCQTAPEKVTPTRNLQTEKNLKRRQ